MTIDTQIYSAFDTGKKMAQNKPDYLLISFSKTDNKIVSTIFKVYNNDKVPFFSLFVSKKEVLAELLKGFLSSERTAFRFEKTPDINIQNIEVEIRRLFFKDWLIKTGNIYQHHDAHMEMALNRIK